MFLSSRGLELREGGEGVSTPNKLYRLVTRKLGDILMLGRGLRGRILMILISVLENVG